jgi:GH15 family glucan-1,4-alpha-glucosidase
VDLAERSVEVILAGQSPSGGYVDDARGRLAWIEAHTAPNGDLPEQSQDHLLRPESFATWVEKWGEPASPLLWSHAMYLRLHHALHDRR